MGAKPLACLAVPLHTLLTSGYSRQGLMLDPSCIMLQQCSSSEFPSNYMKHDRQAGCSDLS